MKHSQTHPLTFGPLGWRTVFGLLSMLLRGQRPIILIGVRVCAEVVGAGKKTRLGSEITASSMQIRNEKVLAKELAEELEKRT